MSDEMDLSGLQQSLDDMDYIKHLETMIGTLKSRIKCLEDENRMLQSLVSSITMHGMIDEVGTTNDSKHENIVCNHCGKTIDATTLAIEKYFPNESIYICKDCYKEE